MPTKMQNSTAFFFLKLAESTKMPRFYVNTIMVLSEPTNFVILFDISENGEEVNVVLALSSTRRQSLFVHFQKLATLQ